MSNLSSRAELIKKIEEDLLEEEKLRSKFEREMKEEKVKLRKGFVQRLQLEKREAALDGVVLKAQEVANLQANEIKQEEKLAAELAWIRQQEIRDEKLRQQLRENSHELKELEKNLKAAYANKILAVQIAENEARKEHEQMFEQRGREVMLSSLGSLDEIEYKAMMDEKVMKEEYRRILQDQIIEKERLKQEEFIAFLKEKKLFEDTIKKIKKEEEKEQAEKLLMKQKIKEEMEQFHAAKEIWKIRERMVIDKENQKLEAEMKLKEKQEAERNLKKNRDIEEQRRVVEKMTSDAMLKKKLREEKQEMLQLIQDGEYEEREARKAEEDLARELMMRQEARREFQKILLEKDQKLREEKELDERFAMQMNLKVREDDEREKEKMERKRRDRIKDRIYNEEMIKRNIQKRAEDLKLAQMAIEFEEREEKRRLEMIEEERIRILKEHAPNLLGYFPKGALKERDLELLGLTGNSPLPKASSQLYN